MSKSRVVDVNTGKNINNKRYKKKRAKSAKALHDIIYAEDENLTDLEQDLLTDQ